MSDIKVFRQSESRPETLPPDSKIQDGRLPDRKPSGGAGNYGEAPGGNSAKNGRAPWPLPNPLVHLQTAWRRRFDPGFGISGLAVARDRVYLDAKTRWSLLDAQSGVSRAGGVRGTGIGSLDAEAGLLYQPDADGQLQGLHVDRGQPAFSSPLPLGNRCQRALSARVGNSLLLLGRGRTLPAPADSQPTSTLLEALPLNPSPESRESGQLQPAIHDPLIFADPDPLAVAWSGGIAIAFTGHIFLVSESLRVEAVLRGSFKPISLSVDEAGWVHLIADEVSGARALWILSPAGVRTLRFLLPAPFKQVKHPPLISSAHSVILRGDSALLCLSSAGAILWARPTGPDAQPMVTGDDKVFVADGHGPAFYDPDGQRTGFLRFDPSDLNGESFATPPLLEEDGTITVATDSTVTRMSPAPPPGKRR